MSSFALDDFDLATYGPDEKVSVDRKGFVVKLVTYSTRKELSLSFEEVSGKKLGDKGVRAFAMVNETSDVCYIHVVPAKIWDDREAMAILGHELYHCALADHKDFFEEDKEEEEDKSIEELYAKDRELELDWLRGDYRDMGIEIDE
jgi:hypothetical protein